MNKIREKTRGEFRSVAVTNAPGAQRRVQECYYFGIREGLCEEMWRLAECVPFASPKFRKHATPSRHDQERPETP